MSTEAFQAALDLLTEVADVIDVRGYLMDPFRAADSPAQPPDAPQRKRLALTFDDGYAETLETVPAVLAERGITACFFVVPAWFGKRAPHAWAPPSLTLADAAQLRAVQQAGHAVASHTWSHKHLDQLSPDAVESELRLAAEALQREGLGAGMEDVVAYPYGSRPANTHGVRFGFGVGRRSNGCPSCRPRAIKRNQLHPTDSSEWRERVATWWQ
jgi:peptidoglycan/xylan/chitin deacetylase (PgdA/CDA1 family)